MAAFTGAQIGGVDELDIEAPRQSELRQPFADAPVEHPRDDDVVTRQERLEHRGGGGHAGREQDAVAVAAFEHRQHPLGLLVGRIVGRE